MPGCAATLLSDQQWSRSDNAPVRQAAMQSMQRTYGNRAVQRYVQRQVALPVQRQDDDDEYRPTLPFPLMGPLTIGWDYLLHSVGRRDKPSREIDPVYKAMWGMMSKGQELTEANERANHDARQAITGEPPRDFIEDADMGMSSRPQYDDVSPALRPWELDEAEAESEQQLDVPSMPAVPVVSKPKRSGPAAIWDALLQQLGKMPLKRPGPGEEGYPYKWDSEGNVEYVRREKPKCVLEYMGESRTPQQWCPDPWDWDQMVAVDPEPKQPEVFNVP
jgi:hypothetical protein